MSEFLCIQEFISHFLVEFVNSLVKSLNLLGFIGYCFLELYIFVFELILLFVPGLLLRQEELVVVAEVVHALETVLLDHLLFFSDALELFFGGLEFATELGQDS
jgi:hypothetical protein